MKVHILPWLSDPQWATTPDEFARVRLVKSVVRLKMPEARPGLASILRNEDGFIRSQVIETLEEARDCSFVPDLREAMRAEKKNSSEDTVRLIRTLIACGGSPIDELATALESCAASAEVSEDEYRSDRRLRIRSPEISFAVSVCQAVADPKYGTEALADAVIERLKTLRKENPEVAAKLWLIAQRWRFPSVALELAERISDGSAVGRAAPPALLPPIAL